MPFKSKAQMRKFFAMERRGELPEGTARKWAHETSRTKRGKLKIPARVGKQAYLVAKARRGWD